jgi:hypothetical protein
MMPAVRALLDFLSERLPLAYRDLDMPPEERAA